MTPNDLQQLLREFYVERLALLVRHEQSARVMGQYDINNAYQYVLAREETHISWLHRALVDVGVDVPADPSAPTDVGKDAAAAAGEDARLNAQFIEKWQERVDTVTHARHRGMLRVVLGEMAEQRRFFEQAAAGRTDLLGTALAINPRVGKVLADRWVQ